MIGEQNVYIKILKRIACYYDKYTFNVLIDTEFQLNILIKITKI